MTMHKEKEMDIKKISFDNGKTFIDIMDDNTFYIVVSKLRKMKNWNIIVDAMEDEAMFKAIKETNLKGQLTNAENRVIFLGAYLKHSKNDLIVKIS